jgi:[ribosomal protein S18]-alanine N-acetyltransferase
MSSSDLRISPMYLADLESVCKIEQAANPNNFWTKENFLNELNSENGHYWVLRKKILNANQEIVEEIIGFIGCQVILNEAFIMNLAVDPQSQGLGNGKALLKHLVTQLSRWNCRYITLEVRAGNLKAQNLYKKFGFEERGLRPNYYPDNSENAVVMWTSDIQTEEYKLLMSSVGQS